jgi:hypothetical protein
VTIDRFLGQLLNWGDTDQGYPRVTIDTLPDNVLLEIFSFDLDRLVPQGLSFLDRDRWQTLVHICQRWRYLVFASPRRLKSQLFCTARRPVKTMLDVWPNLPIAIEDRGLPVSRYCRSGSANIIATLQQHNRVSRIYLYDIKKPMDSFDYFVKMKEPFPVLMDLKLLSGFGPHPVIPETLLCGSAPRLRSLSLSGISFPSLGKLLCTNPDLVRLHILNIPPSGYISPETMVACLSTLTRLQTLSLRFPYLQSFIDFDKANRPSPPLTRIVLPALTLLDFQGYSKYLEGVVSQIDVPLLDNTSVTFLDQPPFLTPLLRYFISSIEVFMPLRNVDIFFGLEFKSVRFYQNGADGVEKVPRPFLYLSYRPSYRHPSSLLQVLDSALPFFSTLECLCISEHGRYRLDDMEGTQWREHLHLFTSLKKLDLCGSSVKFITDLLAELTGERAIGVFIRENLLC